MEEMIYTTTNEIDLVTAQVRSLLEAEDDWVSGLSNISAYLNEILPHINWVGFYLVKKGQLVLGPFQGKVACSRIAIGKGVCGTAVKEKESMRIFDVHQFPGHIACDSASNSELVIPIFNEDQVVAVLDIDSPLLDRFTEIDQSCMEQVAQIIANFLSLTYKK